MNNSLKKDEIITTSVLILIFFDFLISLIIWLSWFKIINLFPFYPNLNILLFPIWAIFWIWTLLKINGNIKFLDEKRPEKLYYKSHQKIFDINRAWEYTKEAEGISQRRINYFLVAESMLLVSFATIGFNKGINKISYAITSLGIIITFYWFYTNARIQMRMQKMLKDYLKKDPVYYNYLAESVNGLSANAILSYALPNTLILFWIFLFCFTFNGYELNLWILKIISFSCLSLIIIALLIKIFIPKRQDKNFHQSRLF